MKTETLPSNDKQVNEARKTITLEPDMKIGRLTLIEKFGEGWICQCSCGKFHYVSKPYRLKNAYLTDYKGFPKIKDSTRSCGCKQDEFFKAANRQGTIPTKYTETTYSGLEIMWRTGKHDENRSEYVVVKCPKCGRYFTTTTRSETKSCGICWRNKNERPETNS